MKTFKEILAIAGKDLQVISKEKGGLFLVIGLPLILGMMLSTVYQSQVPSGDVSEETVTGFLNVSLVNEDTGNYGDQVVETLKLMRVLNLEILKGKDAAVTADKAVAEGKKLALIVIPPDFSQKIDNYDGSSIKLVVDPGQKQFESILEGILGFAVTPAALQGEIRQGIRSVLDSSGALDNASSEIRQAVEAQTLGVVMSQVASMLEKPTIGVEMTSPENSEAAPTINFFNLLMPGFVVMFSFFLIGWVGASLFEEKDAGTFRRLVSAPISRSAVIAGKSFAFGVLVILQVAFLFGVASLLGNLELGDSPLGLALVTLALALTVTTFGLMIGAVSKTGNQANNLGIVLAFVLAGLGGCFQFGLTPLYQQDSLLGKLSVITPQAHALKAYHILMTLGGNVVDVLPQVFILLGFSLVFFLVAVWRLPKFFRN